MLANDEDDTFLIECIEQFENCIPTTSPNNNELIGENSITDNTANTADITDNTGTINEENKHDINNDRDNSNEFLMEGGGWLWQEFQKLPQPTALETIQSGYVNEKPFDAVQDVGLINNAVCADNNNEFPRFSQELSLEMERGVDAIQSISMVRPVTITDKSLEMVQNDDDDIQVTSLVESATITDEVTDTNNGSVPVSHTTEVVNSFKHLED
ncbi:uncharacterized protein LOC113005997 isoform X2 [Solenopsis invicta]|uniref:uncharacterized protein LOC113005997 isoform X2 n=1 Tax=Solenopsis invicta TaxID=13686 RepID=UPI00193D80DF|nr:uncharacterized protein LOC113005997 isoform X2 [Solenopsis invicta]